MKKYIIILSLVFTALSCNKFVDVIPKGKSIPSTVDDLAELMNSSTFNTPDYSRSQVLPGVAYLDLVTDDSYLEEDPTAYKYFYKATKAQQNMSTWAPYYYDGNESDPNWDKHYASNYIVNYVLANIDKATPGVVYDRDDIKGRALVNRAMNYLVLVNIYANHYDVSSADKDLGVPLILEPDITKQYSRATVKEVYDQILKDLETALTLLKHNTHPYNHLPGKATANAIMARAYLYMGDYTKSYSYATEALKLKSTVYDYNKIEFSDPEVGARGGLLNYEQQGVTSPEMIYSRDYSGIGGYISKELLSLYDDNDLRYRFWYVIWPEVGFKGYMRMNSDADIGIGASEVWLMKAETAIRKKDADINAAIEALDKVRINRIDKAAYKPTTENNPDNLLKLVLEERRREFAGGPQRLFDLKRLNKDPKTAKTLTRTYFEQTYTLPPNDPRYVFPIPQNVMALNPKLVQNPAPGR